MKRALWAGMTALALGASLTACGGSAGLASGDDYSVMGALEELPRLSGKEVLVQTGDVVSAEQAAHLSRPSSLQGDWYREWLQPLTLSKDNATWLPYPGYPGDQGWAQPTRKVYGFSILDVDSFANVNAGADQFTVVEGGSLDGNTLPADLRPVAEGVVTDLKGADGEVDVAHATDANRIGRPVRLAERDHMIAASPSTDDVKAWKQADLDATMADDGPLQALAKTLDDADVSSALLLQANFASGIALGGHLTPAQLTKLRGKFLPQSFDAVGLGWAATDGASTIVVVYHFADEDTASAAEPRLAKIWGDGTSLQMAEPLSKIMTVKDSTADGDTVTVTLTPAEGSSSRVVVNMLMNRDLPFVHR